MLDPDRTPAPSIRGESLYTDSDIISITDSHHPLTDTSTNPNSRRRSSISWMNRRFSRSNSRAAPASIAIDPSEIPVLDGRVTSASLERTSVLLSREPLKFTTKHDSDFMARAASVFDHTLRVVASDVNDTVMQEVRFQKAYERHAKNANDTDARREFKALAEAGHISGMIMYATILRLRRQTQAALAYLYAAARLIIAQIQRNEALSTNMTKIDQLHLTLSEIARTFMYPGDTLSQPDARAFYAAGADVGDWEGMYQLGGSYLYGEGGEKNAEVGRLLIARSKAMRKEGDTIQDQ